MYEFHGIGIQLHFNCTNDTGNHEIQQILYRIFKKILLNILNNFKLVLNTIELKCSNGPIEDINRMIKQQRTVFRFHSYHHIISRIKL